MVLICGTAAAQTNLQYTTFWRLLGPTIQLVGRDLNGVSLNGDLLSGRQVTGVSLDGAWVNGKKRSVKLARSHFFGGGIGGGNMVGAELQADLDDGTTLMLRVDGVQRHPDPANKDVLLYEVSYATGGGRVSLCGLDDEGYARRAIPLEGRWDLSQGTVGGGSWIEDQDRFTFACEDHVIGKCVLGGYEPWRKVLVCTKGKGCSMTTLADHHQACTRMLRADYCGDGTSHTVDDVEVNLYDGLGVRTDSEAWSFEAEWDAQGAFCASDTRLQAAKPACMQQLQDKNCGAPQHFADGTLLMSEYLPQP